MRQANFDIDAAIQALRDGKDLMGKAGILTPLIKPLTQSALQAELENHLQNHDSPNRKNGTISKPIKSTAGHFELDTPRDRAGTYEPQRIKNIKCTSPMRSNARSSVYLPSVGAIRISANILRRCTASMSLMGQSMPVSFPVKQTNQT